MTGCMGNHALKIGRVRVCLGVAVTPVSTPYSAVPLSERDQVGFALPCPVLSVARQAREEGG